MHCVSPGPSTFCLRRGRRRCRWFVWTSCQPAASSSPSPRSSNPRQQEVTAQTPVSTAAAAFGDRGARLAGRVREGTGGGSPRRPALLGKCVCAVCEACGPVASRMLSFLCFMQFSFTVFRCAFQFTFLPSLSLALQTAGHVSNIPNENSSLSNATVNIFPYIGVSVYTRDNTVNSLPRSLGAGDGTHLRL